MRHRLHLKATELIEGQLSDLWDQKVRLVKDQACGGHQQIPLFLNENKSRKTELCKVDLALIKDGQIEVIIEIDNKIIPTQICGKFLTSALSSFYIHRKESKPIPLSDDVLFVQILDSGFDHLVEKEKTAKIEQGRNIERSIQDLISKLDLKVRTYKLFWAAEDDLRNLEDLIKILRGKLSQS